jgi:hypothetical protein
MKRKWGCPWKMSKQKYGLVTECTAHRDTVGIWPWARTYGQSVIGKPYFHQPFHSSYFLVIELCFSRNRTDDRSFLSIRGYGALKELHGGALRPEWVQTHMDALLLLSYIAYLFYIYIYQTCIFCNSHEIHFGTTGDSLLWKHVSFNKIIMRLVKLCM